MAHLCVLFDTFKEVTTEWRQNGSALRSQKVTTLQENDAPCNNCSIECLNLIREKLLTSRDTNHMTININKICPCEDRITLGQECKMSVLLFSKIAFNDSGLYNFTINRTSPEPWEASVSWNLAYKLSIRKFTFLFSLYKCTL